MIFPGAKKSDKHPQNPHYHRSFNTMASKILEIPIDPKGDSVLMLRNPTNNRDLIGWEFHFRVSAATLSEYSDVWKASLKDLEPAASGLTFSFIYNRKIRLVFNPSLSYANDSTSRMFLGI